MVNFDIRSSIGVTLERRFRAAEVTMTIRREKNRRNDIGVALKLRTHHTYLRRVLWR